MESALFNIWDPRLGQWLVRFSGNQNNGVPASWSPRRSEALAAPEADFFRISQYWTYLKGCDLSPVNEPQTPKE